MRLNHDTIHSYLLDRPEACHGALLNPLRSRNTVDSPTNVALQPPNVDLANAKVSSYGPLRSSVRTNARNLLFGQLGTSVPLASRRVQRPMLVHIKHVPGLGVISKVQQGCVGRVAIVVRNHHAVRARPHERLHNQDVNLEALMLPIKVQTNNPISPITEGCLE
jgi:hypothetical protein